MSVDNIKQAASDVHSEGEFKVYLACCEMVLLNEIAQKECKRNDISKTYRLALVAQAENGEVINWLKVNTAITDRWSFSGLNWIKDRAWSGKCFEVPHAKS